MSTIKSFDKLYRSVVIPIISLLYLLFSAQAQAADWKKFENASFEAYSDASNRKTIGMLTELENFQAAFSQVIQLSIPEMAPKTQVIIFDKKNDFYKLVGNQRYVGFVTSIDGIPYLVMPASSRNHANKTIRHEYAHVLMGYKGRRYPAWYIEGFAEFMSATRFKDKGKKFSLGERTDRTLAPSNLLSWEELISDDFDFHSIKSIPRASNAYLQSWYLAHYMILGENLSMNQQLNQYLALYAEGTSSIEAFEQVFKVSPDEFGRELIKDYDRSMPYYMIDFKSGTQDLNFERSEANQSEVQEIIEKLTERVQTAFADE